MKMKVRKNYRNTWLEGDRMEQHFPELVKFYSGSGWGEEDETIINSYGLEFKKDKLVSFYSTNGDIAKLINRCAKAIEKIKLNSYDDGTLSGVEFIVNKNAFRNPIVAFNTKYAPDNAYETGHDKIMTKEHKQKLVEARQNGRKKKEE